MIFPIMIYNFNTISLSFFIPNILISFIIGPCLFLGYICLLLPTNIGILFAKIEEVLVKIIFLISDICSKLPFSNIYIKTPNIVVIIFYYLILFYAVYIFSKGKKSFIKDIKRFKIPIKLRKILIIYLAIIVSFNTNLNHNLKIYFVDVGQGDSTVIVTPNGKKIIIDGGEETEGKMLLSYLLDRGITKIDYMIFSHFDSDHCGGLLYIMEELKVNVAVISEQGETSDNYERFKQIVKEKNIKVLKVNMGDRIEVENDIYFDILWPNRECLISDNVLNNNSIVCKLYYNGFSMLFTGDIEEMAERQLLNNYRNNLIVLNSTILKVGHHGSKTSSIQNFIDVVNPYIALIGVGKNNKFGHPSNEVLERLQESKAKIFRTDIDGEIRIYIDSKGKIVKFEK